LQNLLTIACPCEAPYDDAPPLWYWNKGKLKHLANIGDRTYV